MSDKILDAAYAVHKKLGEGLLESAYEGAFAVELRYFNVHVDRQVVYPLVYRDEYIGAYIADIVVDNRIIVEIKAVSKLNIAMESQVINYLKLSKLQVASCMPSMATPLPAILGREDISSTFIIQAFNGGGSLIPGKRLHSRPFFIACRMITRDISFMLYHTID